ncbi:MAG TPA: hypothetical protein VI589_00275 [Vicinamibacteria bacterium]
MSSLAIPVYAHHERRTFEDTKRRPAPLGARTQGFGDGVKA